MKFTNEDVLNVVRQMGLMPHNSNKFPEKQPLACIVREAMLNQEDMYDAVNDLEEQASLLEATACVIEDIEHAVEHKESKKKTKKT